MVHTRMISTLSVLVALLVALLGCDTGPNIDTGKDIDTDPPARQVAQNVLFIGNSLTYTNDLPEMLRRLYEVADLDNLSVEQVTRPNYGLEDHWSGGQIQREITGGGWDVVVVQQGPSATEGRPSLIEYCKRFSALASDAGAQLAVFMVWPSSSRSFDMDGVSRSHQMAADSSGALLYPVMEAWREAWRRKPSLALYGGDGFHPSEMGSYLAALVMFEQMAGMSPVGLPSTLDGLSSSDLQILQESAVEANRRFRRSRP